MKNTRAKNLATVRRKRNEIKEYKTIFSKHFTTCKMY